MERKKLFVRIGIGAAGVLLLVAVFAGVSMVGERNHLRHGMEEGFELRGTYQLPSGASITFQVFDAERSWEAQNGPDAVVKGTIKETVDPNIYLLEDERGEEVGWVREQRRRGRLVRALRFGRLGGDRQGGQGSDLPGVRLTCVSTPRCRTILRVERRRALAILIPVNAST